MPRFALKIEYLGQRFCGSQFQSGVRTVQDELEKALGTFLRSPHRRLPVVLSGRTDSGVHARGQVAHFDWAEEDLDLWRLCWAINGIVGADLAATHAQLVPDEFHARFSAIKRNYSYRILNTPQPSPSLKHTHYFVPLPLAVPVVAELTKQLVGSHDFQGFKTANTDTTTTVCCVESAELLNLGEGRLEFRISANHFVYNMVRIIVGTLVEIGLGKRPMTDLGEALLKRQRQKAGPTAPPWGLCLESVEYPEEYHLFESASFQEPVLSNQEIHRE